MSYDLARNQPLRSSRTSAFNYKESSARDEEVVEVIPAIESRAHTVDSDGFTTTDNESDGDHHPQKRRRSIAYYKRKAHKYRDVRDALLRHDCAGGHKARYNLQRKNEKLKRTGREMEAAKARQDNEVCALRKIIERKEWKEERLEREAERLKRAMEAGNGSPRATKRAFEDDEDPDTTEYEVPEKRPRKKAHRNKRAYKLKGDILASSRSTNQQ